MISSQATNHPFKDRLESWFDSALSLSPAQPVFIWRAAKQLAVLGYHGIDDPERFERHMDYIKKKMHPISVQDLLAVFRNGDGLPERAVLITFDDGDRSLIDFALPILKQKEIPAVAFLIAGILGTQTAFWWDEVTELIGFGGKVEAYQNFSAQNLVRALKKVSEEQRLVAIKELRVSAGKPASAHPQIRNKELLLLESAGITVGNHSLTHPIFPRCSDEQIIHEISESHRILSAALGRTVETFAYPNGDSDPRATPILAQLGYEAAFLFDHRISHHSPANRFEISRLRINSSTTMDRFRIIVSGLHPVIYRLLR